jgi:hypothetical protein
VLRGAAVCLLRACCWCWAAGLALALALAARCLAQLMVAAARRHHGTSCSAL